MAGTGSSWGCPGHPHPYRPEGDRTSTPSSRTMTPTGVNHSPYQAATATARTRSSCGSLHDLDDLMMALILLIRSFARSVFLRRSCFRRNGDVANPVFQVREPHV